MTEITAVCIRIMQTNRKEWREEEERKKYNEKKELLNRNSIARWINKQSSRFFFFSFLFLFPSRCNQLNLSLRLYVRCACSLKPSIIWTCFSLCFFFVLYSFSAFFAILTMKEIALQHARQFLNGSIESSFTGSIEKTERRERKKNWLSIELNDKDDKRKDRIAIR